MDKKSNSVNSKPRFPCPDTTLPKLLPVPVPGAGEVTLLPWQSVNVDRFRHGLMVNCKFGLGKGGLATNYYRQMTARDISAGKTQPIMVVVSPLGTLRQMAPELRKFFPKIGPISTLYENEDSLATLLASHVFLTTFDALSNPKAMAGGKSVFDFLRGLDYDGRGVVVVDEAHVMRGVGVKYTNVVRLTQLMDRILFLTATPIVNTAMDLCWMAQCMGQGVLADPAWWANADFSDTAKLRELRDEWSKINIRHEGQAGHAHVRRAPARNESPLLPLTPAQSTLMDAMLHDHLPDIHRVGEGTDGLRVTPGQPLTRILMDVHTAGDIIFSAILNREGCAQYLLPIEAQPGPGDDGPGIQEPGVQLDTSAWHPCRVEAREHTRAAARALVTHRARVARQVAAGVYPASVCTPTATGIHAHMRPRDHELRQVVVTRHSKEFHPPDLWTLLETSTFIQFLFRVLPVFLNNDKRVLLVCARVEFGLMVQAAVQVLYDVWYQEGLRRGSVQPGDPVPVVRMMYGNMKEPKRREMMEFINNSTPRANPLNIVTKAGVLGINFNTSCVVIHMGCTEYTPTTRLQGFGRATRVDQMNPVLLMSLVAHTVMAHVANAVQLFKETLASDILRDRESPMRMHSRRIQKVDVMGVTAAQHRHRTRKRGIDRALRAQVAAEATREAGDGESKSPGALPRPPVEVLMQGVDFRACLLPAAQKRDTPIDPAAVEEWASAVQEAFDAVEEETKAWDGVLDGRALSAQIKKPAWVEQVTARLEAIDAPDHLADTLADFASQSSGKHIQDDHAYKTMTIMQLLSLPPPACRLRKVAGLDPHCSKCGSPPGAVDPYINSGCLGPVLGSLGDDLPADVDELDVVAYNRWLVLRAAPHLWDSDAPCGDYPERIPFLLRLPESMMNARDIHRNNPATATRTAPTMADPEHCPDEDDYRLVVKLIKNLATLNDNGKVCNLFDEEEMATLGPDGVSNIPDDKDAARRWLVEGEHWVPPNTRRINTQLKLMVRDALQEDIKSDCITGRPGSAVYRVISFLVSKKFKRRLDTESWLRQQDGTLSVTSPGKTSKKRKASTKEGDDEEEKKP